MHQNKKMIVCQCRGCNDEAGRREGEQIDCLKAEQQGREIAASAAFIATRLSLQKVALIEYRIPALV